MVCKVITGLQGDNYLSNYEDSKILSTMEK
jgi:hypothetical protein